MKGRLHRAFSPIIFLPDGYAMLMRPKKAETAVYGFHWVIWLCACVRYWPDCGLLLSVSLAFIVVFMSRGLFLDESHGNVSAPKIHI